MLFALYAFPAAAAPILVIEPATKNVVAGDTFSLDISISDVVDLYAFEFDLGFDPTVFGATSITEGAFLSTAGATFFIPGAIDNAAGNISFTANTLIGALPGVSGDGVLATVLFSAVGAGTSPVNLFGVTLLDSSLSGIATTTQGGSVVAIQGVVPEPSVLLLLGTSLAALQLSPRRRAT